MATLRDAAQRFAPASSGSLATLQVFVIQGALLMFMMQPLVGRMLLPTYGGGFQVWTTCLVFFQGTLLLGYTYAHLVLPRIGPWHLGLVVLSLLSLPLGISASPHHDVLGIVEALVVHISLPFFVLSTTGVLTQLWLAGADHVDASDPYYLYAASNVGSLVGLVSYPLLIEPLLGLAWQRGLWSAAYVAYAVLAIVVALKTRPGAAPSALLVHALPLRRIVYWLLLSAGGSALLLAVTNIMALGAGSIPFVWVAALAVYLSSYISAFSREPSRARFVRRLYPEAVLLALLVYSEPLSVSELWLNLGLLVSLFVLCFVGHSEIYDTRPPVGQLTVFYLSVATGGLLGGAFVAVGAPLWFDRFLELPAALSALTLTLAVARRRALAEWLLRRRSWAAGGRARLGPWVRLVLVSVVLVWAWPKGGTGYMFRNFYGQYNIWERVRSPDADGKERTIRILSHNETNHGFQSLLPAERGVPTGYFHRASPLGEVLQSLPHPRRAAVIGLGAGTVAAYFERGEELVFYELDPDNERIAREWFTFVEDCEADLRIVVGDARLMLAQDESLEDGELDVLLVDAFAGDAIPFHLITREAMALYLRKVSAEGQVIFHISSRFYELWPTVAATARTVGAMAAHKQRTRFDGHDLGPLEWSSHYMVVSRHRPNIEALGRRGWMIVSPKAPGRAWTDDYVNVLGPLWHKWRL